MGEKITNGLSAGERMQALRNARPAGSPFDPYHVWSDADIHRLRLAYKLRFDEPLPRTETLMAVAAEGIRIWHERTRP